MTLKSELQSIEPTVATEAVKGWLDKMGDLFDTPEGVTERNTKNSRYPVIPAITIAIMQHCEEIGRDEQRVHDTAAGAKIALSVLTEIAEVREVPSSESFE